VWLDFTSVGRRYLYDIKSVIFLRFIWFERSQINKKTVKYYTINSLVFFFIISVKDSYKLLLVSDKADNLIFLNALADI
jgi:hypothetical protein